MRKEVEEGWRHDGGCSRRRQRLSALLEHERLCDAVADAELRDMGLDDDVASVRLVQLYRELRRQAPWNR